jgi:hypothetical protein
VTAPPSPIRRAKADALRQHVAAGGWAFWRRPKLTPPPQVRGELGLISDEYDRLRAEGLSRADVAKAVDDLVDGGGVTATAENGIVVLRLAGGDGR